MKPKIEQATLASVAAATEEILPRYKRRNERLDRERGKEEPVAGFSGFGYPAAALLAVVLGATAWGTFGPKSTKVEPCVEVANTSTGTVDTSCETTFPDKK